MRSVVERLRFPWTAAGGPLGWQLPPPSAAAGSRTSAPVAGCSREGGAVSARWACCGLIGSSSGPFLSHGY